MAELSSPYTRAHQRSMIVTHDVRGVIADINTKQQSSFILWDISDHGMRLLLPVGMEPQQLVRITLVRPVRMVFTASVRWCSQMDGYGGFQLGLDVMDNIPALEKLHSKLACSPDNSVAPGAF